MEEEDFDYHEPHENDQLLQKSQLKDPLPSGYSIIESDHDVSIIRDHRHSNPISKKRNKELIGGNQRKSSE
jgi:hypothetical protein